jgi:hypothetical protein
MRSGWLCMSGSGANACSSLLTTSTGWLASLAPRYGYIHQAATRCLIIRAGRTREKTAHPGGKDASRVVTSSQPGHPLLAFRAYS